MAKQRYINTSFWHDSYIVSLDSLAKLLYIYLFTNSFTSICGIYEISLPQVALDTGLSPKQIIRLISQFSADGKIYYISGWVWVRNFVKHQKENDSIKKGIENSLSLIPEAIKAKIQSLSTVTPQTVTSLGTETDLIESEIELKSKPKSISAPTGASGDRFNEFWKAYPKKRSRGQAIKAWNKIKPDEQLHNRILKAVEQAKTSEQWTKDFGQFIPYPATWLNAQGWEDDISAPRPRFTARPVESDEAIDAAKKRQALARSSGSGMQSLKDALPENLRKRLPV